MGYYAEINTNMVIPGDKVAEAFTTLVEQHKASLDEALGWHAPERHTLDQLLQGAGFEINRYVDGSIEIERFADSLREQDSLLQALLPFSYGFLPFPGAPEPAPFFEVHGEDGEKWRYEYADGKTQFYIGKTVWEPVEIS